MKKINRFLFIILIFLSQTAAVAQTKYALLVGINKYYTDPGIEYSSQLRGCVNDAQAIKSQLVRRFGFSEGNIQTFYDEAATTEHVMQAFNNILGKCKAGDAVVFYFSGHGVWMKNDRQNSLDTAVKRNMNQAMVMSNLYADNLGCLFTDALVKRTFNKFIDKKVITTAILDCCYSGKIPATYRVQEVNDYDMEIPAYGTEKAISFTDIFQNYIGYTQETKGSYSEDSLNAILVNRLSDPESKSFNLKDSLHINDPSLITRPSERPGSMFLSLAATNEYQKGMDITDETEIFHGAYTAALLHVLNNNPANITMAELIRKTDLEMKRQAYPQSPMCFRDPQRMTKNLIGIEPVNFHDEIAAVCTKITGKAITLDGGLLDGIAAGNLLRSPGSGTTLRVTAAQKNTATAIAVIGNASAIKNGDRFILTKNITASKPLVKLFVAGLQISPPDFNAYIKKDVAPYLYYPNYRDYGNWDKKHSRNVFFSKNFTPDANGREISTGFVPDDFYVFLPLPSFITEPLKKIMAGNQNVHMVDSASQADLILYLNYTKPGKGGKPAFVFTWTNLRDAAINEPGTLNFYQSHVKVKQLTADTNTNRALALQINDLLIPYIRTKTTHWLNDWPK